MKEEKVKGIPSSIIGIHPLLDHNYFVCSAFNSKVRMFTRIFFFYISIYIHQFYDWLLLS